MDMNLRLRIKRIKKRTMLKLLIGVIVGGIVGFLYYKFIGCSTGTCRITSNPYISTVYFALLGALVANMF